MNSAPSRRARFALRSSTNVDGRRVLCFEGQVPPWSKTTSSRECYTAGARFRRIADEAVRKERCGLRKGKRKDSSGRRRLPTVVRQGSHIEMATAQRSLVPLRQEDRGQVVAAVRYGGGSRDTIHERAFVKRGRCRFCVAGLPHIPVRRRLPSIWPISDLPADELIVQR
jgi:hypothetical protein